MERFKNILLVVNSKIKNPAALLCAFSLAKNNNAKLKIVDVVEEKLSYQPILPQSVKNINLRELLVEEKKEALRRILKPLRKKELKHLSKFLQGYRL